MTAISHPVLAARHTRLRLTPRGRRVLAFVAALPAVVAITFALINGGSAIASRDAGAAESFSTVTVTYGDTLWSIAERVAPTADPRDVIDSIARLNALSGGTLSIGEELAIPAEYDAAQ
ncbi:LysM peptidoglycan-binding domain-containing protein [Planococcus sp. APC 4015]|nr:LysM peptidoglycan-binding domain-containing protein [Planococcus sp. APC 4015]